MQKKTIPLCLPFSFFVRIGLLIFGTTLFVRPIYYYLTEGFSLKRTEVTIDHDPALVLAPPSKELIDDLAQITRQPFHYLKKGSQAYAFISEDGKYILKLFKFHHMHSVAWLKKIPFPKSLAKKRDLLVLHRQQRIDLTLHSYKIAQEDLKDECALLFTQILPCSSYSLPATIIDPVGRTYTRNLAHYGFALQRCAKLVIPSLHDWIEKGDIAEAKKALSSLVGLHVARSKLGIQDIDPDLHKNAGFLGTTAVHIDIGSFLKNKRISSSEKMIPEIQKTFRKLEKWLEVKSPELAAFLEEKIQNPEQETWAYNYSSKR